MVTASAGLGGVRFEEFEDAVTARSNRMDYKKYFSRCFKGMGGKSYEWTKDYDTVRDMLKLEYLLRDFPILSRQISKYKVKTTSFNSEYQEGRLYTSRRFKVVFDNDKYIEILIKVTTYHVYFNGVEVRNVPSMLKKVTK